MPERGKYIVVEGSDGVGKTTQMELLKQKCADEDLDVVFTREPGGSKLGLPIRKILLDPATAQIKSAEAEIALFTADRAELWAEVIEPALEENRIVISDRNWFSTLAYQTASKPELVSKIVDLTNLLLPPRYVSPDLAIILQLSEKERKRRRDQREQGVTADSFESRDEAFFQRVFDTYRSLPTRMGATAILADPEPEIVFNSIWAEISKTV